MDGEQAGWLTTWKGLFSKASIFPGPRCCLGSSVICAAFRRNSGGSRHGYLSLSARRV